MSQQNNNQSGEEKTANGFLRVLSVLIILGVIVFIGVKFVQCQAKTESTQQSELPQTSNQQCSNGNNKLFSRSANNGDIIIDSDLDLSSFGMKCVVSPQRDITNLELTIEFLDSNENVLTTKVKSLGNVKKGAQVSFSISIVELGLSATWKTHYARVAVSGGTVSYFS